MQRTVTITLSEYQLLSARSQDFKNQLAIEEANYRTQLQNDRAELAKAWKEINVLKHELAEDKRTYKITLKEDLEKQFKKDKGLEYKQLLKTAKAYKILLEKLRKLSY
jgi:hypothetical protein